MQIHVGACNWQHSSWLGSFYPEDLPEEWRLSYYANEFHTVLVPAYITSTLGRGKLQTLFDDVTSRFIFIFEVDDNSLSDCISNFNSEKTDQSLIVANFSRSKKEIVTEDVIIQRADVLKVLNLQNEIVVLRISSINVMNPKKMRQLIDVICHAFSEHETVFLFFDGQINSPEMLKLSLTLLELMGIAG